MHSFRLAHTFAAGSATLAVCAIVVPVAYHDWSISILWAGAAFISAYMARNETREVREYRRYMRQLDREANAGRFYANATKAEDAFEVAE